MTRSQPRLDRFPCSKSVVRRDNVAGGCSAIGTKLVKRALALALLVPFGGKARAEPVSGFVRAEGKRLIGPDGREFLVRGVNLGHWLVPEAYLLGFDCDTT